MEPYDAIVEQLKRAQGRGLEAVKNRLDFVLETLDELVQEAKTSVQEAVPQDAEELFPTSDLEQAATALCGRLEAAEARVAELESQAQAGPPQPAGGATGLPLDWLRTLDAARSQSEVLRALLPMVAEHAGRAVVLVLRGGSVSAWSGIGFAEGERLRSWQGAADASDVLQRFTDAAAPVRFDAAEDPVFSLWLAGEDAPAEAMLLPVVLRGRLMGALYIDRLAGGAWDPELVQGLVAMVCLLIDTLHHRQQVPTPTLAETVDLRSGEVAEAAPPAGAVPEPEPEPERSEDEPVAPEEEPVPAAEEAAEEDAEEAAAVEIEEEEYDPSATVAVTMGGEAPPVEVVEELSEEVAVEEPAGEAVPPDEEAREVSPEAGAEEEAETEAEEEGPPPVQPVTPPPVKPVTPPAEPAGAESFSAEEQTQHEEARRFARLLVSEIKLYNEEEVDRGRGNNDLYARLKEDIDRSREMFEKRIPPEVRAQRDYFHEELVRVLADGDEDALGM